MKTTLTTQESAELIKRGVTLNENDFEVFDIGELLSLLPKHIPFANAEWYLNIQWDILDNKWHVQYLDFDHYDEVVKEEEAPELIDALYQLTLAVINHVKLD